MAALTPGKPIGPERPEVVLDQAILGLLLKWAAIPAVGN
jgi:hypothetical protein